MGGQVGETGEGAHVSARAVVRRLTSDSRGEPRWEATVNGQEHEVVRKYNQYLWCVTCGRAACKGVTAVTPHYERLKDQER